MTFRGTRVRRTRRGLVPSAAPRGYADHLGTDAPRKPRRTPTPTPHTHSPVSGALLLLPSEAKEFIITLLACFVFIHELILEVTIIYVASQ